MVEKASCLGTNSGSALLEVIAALALTAISAGAFLKSSSRVFNRNSLFERQMAEHLLHQRFLSALRAGCVSSGAVVSMCAVGGEEKAALFNHAADD